MIPGTFINKFCKGCAQKENHIAALTRENKELTEGYAARVNKHLEVAERVQDLESRLQKSEQENGELKEKIITMEKRWYQLVVELKTQSHYFFTPEQIEKIESDPETRVEKYIAILAVSKAFLEDLKTMRSSLLADLEKMRAALERIASAQHLPELGCNYPVDNCSCPSDAELAREALSPKGQGGKP